MDYSDNFFPGDTFVFRVSGVDFRATVCEDSDSSSFDHDGNIDAYVIQYGHKKKPEEIILVAPTMRQHGRAYSLRDAIALALRDGWGPAQAGKTKRQTALRAVQENAEYLRAWFEDNWHYVGLTVERIGAHGLPTGDEESLYGLEAFGEYVRADAAPELAENILYPARKAWREALKAARIERAYRQLARVQAGAF